MSRRRRTSVAHRMPSGRMSTVTPPLAADGNDPSQVARRAAPASPDRIRRSRSPTWRPLLGDSAVGCGRRRREARTRWRNWYELIVRLECSEAVLLVASTVVWTSRAIGLLSGGGGFGSLAAVRGVLPQDPAAGDRPGLEWGFEPPWLVFWRKWITPGAGDEARGAARWSTAEPLRRSSAGAAVGEFRSRRFKPAPKRQPVDWYQRDIADRVSTRRTMRGGLTAGSNQAGLSPTIGPGR